MVKDAARDDTDDRVRSGGSRRMSFRRRAARVSLTKPEAVQPAPVGDGDPAGPAAVRDGDVVQPVGTVRKGRATPKRSETQRRRGGPVPPPPTSRREAATRLRQQKAEQRRSGQAPADAARLLPRDAGPARRVARDVIDSRRNIAVLMLPCAVLLIIASVTKNTGVLAVLSAVWVATLIAVAIDVVLVGLTVRRRLRSGGEDGAMFGHVLYAVMRSTVVRRFRSPVPQVSPPRLFGTR